MGTKEKAREDVLKIEDKTINEACKSLKSYTKSIREYLYGLVAGLCDVEPRIMLYDTKKQYAVHARWFYWYCYRYMTRESSEEIARHSSMWRYFSRSTVQNAISNMGMMAGENGIWRKRWFIVKEIIDIINDNNFKEQDLCLSKTVTLRVNAPKDVNIEIKRD